jgi:DNA-binding transcriptional ArsR family regulator
MDDRFDGTGGDRLPAAERDIGAVFDALRNRHGRYALYRLQRQRECSLAELAAGVVALDRGVAPSAATPRAVRRAYLELYHRHLPVLESAGGVEYSRDDGRVRFVDDHETLERLLDIARRDDGAETGAE